jgi:hypothetical protein
MSVSKKIKKSFAESWCMKFKTRHPEGDSYDGIVVHLTNEFVALQTLDDFEFDGVNVFWKSALKGFRDNKFDICMNGILHNNGQLRRLRIPLWLKKCETFSDLILTLKKREIWPAIEVIGEDDSGCLYIGPITAIEKANFSVECYDAAGKWDGVAKFGFNEVFRLEFGTRYTKHFNNYMKRKVDEYSNSCENE